MQRCNQRTRRAHILALATAVFLLAESAQIYAQDRDIAVDAMRGEKRVALVVGNGAYATAPLRNPTNDARAMADALRVLGFEVLAYQNINQNEMKRAVNAFGEQLRGGNGVGLFFFAGHGMQVNGRNYLIPIGAHIEVENDVEIEALDVGTVLNRMEAARSRLNIVVLDACRDNPFGRSFRSAVRGLASIDAPSGTMIAYATAPGRVARDGSGVNGLYTGELLKVLREPGLKLEDVFKRAGSAVRRLTNGQQVPWVASSVEGDFMFTLPPTAARPSATLQLEEERRRLEEDRRRLNEERRVAEEQKRIQEERTRIEAERKRIEEERQRAQLAAIPKPVEPVPQRPVALPPGQAIKIGVLYDHSGLFAAAGSLNAWRGTKLAIDAVNERGGVLGRYKIVQVDGDAQSKAEVAINEAERLINVEKVDILAGIYSSAHAVPIAERVDKQKKFLWITTAISSKVFDGRNLQYVFRPQVTGDQFGRLSVQYINDYAQEKLKMASRDLRLAVIYEDGAYGTEVALGNELRAQELGLNLVLKEGYSVNAPDLSSLVTKLRAARPDVIFHTGYNPDISLFLRQAKEQGVRTRAYIGHGAGHSQLNKLKGAFGKDIEWFHTLDPLAAQLLDPKKLRLGVGDLTVEMVKRYKAQYDPNVPTSAIAPHVSMGFNNIWILLNDVLPRAIQKHGGFTPDALAKAARETDIAEGGTMQGYGVKFYPPGHRFAGQNERSFPAVFQVIEGKFELVYPKTVATAAPVLPLPASSPFAAR